MLFSPESSPPPPPELGLRRLIAIGLTATAFLATGSLTTRTIVDIQSRMLRDQQIALEQVRVLQEQRHYRACLDRLDTLPWFLGSSVAQQRQLLQSTCQEGLDRMTLQQAQELANTGHYGEAIKRAQTIVSPSLQEQTQAFILYCSKQILQVAQEYYQMGKLNDAIFVTGTLTSENSLYQKAQEQIAWFQADWFAQKARYEAATRAFNDRDLSGALTHIQTITHPFWIEQAQPLKQRIEAQQHRPDHIISRLAEKIVQLVGWLFGAILALKAVMH